MAVPRLPVRTRDHFRGGRFVRGIFPGNVYGWYVPVCVRRGCNKEDLSRGVRGSGV